MGTVGVEEGPTHGPAADALAALVDRVRFARSEAGDEQRVTAGIAEVLRRGSGSVRQRTVYAEAGDLAAVVRVAVEATHGDDTAGA